MKIKLKKAAYLFDVDNEEYTVAMVQFENKTVGFGIYNQQDITIYRDNDYGNPAINQKNAKIMLKRALSI